MALYRRLALSLIAFVFASTGCRRPQTDWEAQSTNSQRVAEEAWRRGDVKAAAVAARQAREAVEQLQKLSKQDTNSADLAASLATARVAERAARTHAERAEEERERRDLLKSWKVRTYQKARRTMLGTIVPQLANAADIAATRGTGQLSVVEQKLAATAQAVCQLNPEMRAGSQPDWTAMATRLRQWTTNEPIELRVFLGLSFLVVQQPDFALVEFEGMDVTQVRDTNILLICHGGRALFYALRGWSHLAAPEAEAFVHHADGVHTNGDVGPQIVAFLHGMLAIQAQKKGDWRKADAAIARSFQAWPDNPVATFLTGEQLAANGEWEKAADSLEQRAKGFEEAWVAQRLAERARELRDGKGSTQALMDPRFLTRLSAEMAIRAATSPALREKTSGLLQSAHAFGADLLQQLPFAKEKTEP